MDNRFGEQIGLPGNHFLKQQMQESGLETSIDPFTAVAGITAIVGAGASAIGGMQAADAAQSNANKSAKFQEEMADYNWEVLKDKESYAAYEVEVARINEESARDFRDQIMLDKYNRELYIRDYNYRSLVEEYNKTEGQYARQVDYNAMSATLARDEQTLWMDEQLKQASFDYEGLLLESRSLDIKAGRTRDTYALNQSDISLKQRGQRAEFVAKSMEGWQKKLQAEGKARAMGQAGRSGRKNRQSVLAMAGQQQAMLNSMVTRSDLSFVNEQLKNSQEYSYARQDIDVERAGVDLGYRRIDATIESATAQNKANLLRIEHQNYGADMVADNQRLSPPTAYEDLPSIPAPYYSPQTHFADAYKTEKKPPGGPGAPNLTAGAGWKAAGTIMSGISQAAAMYNPSAGTGGGVTANSIAGSAQASTASASQGVQNAVQGFFQ